MTTADDPGIPLAFLLWGGGVGARGELGKDIGEGRGNGKMGGRWWIAGWKVGREG